MDPLPGLRPSRRCARSSLLEARLRAAERRRRACDRAARPLLAQHKPTRRARIGRGRSSGRRRSASVLAGGRPLAAGAPRSPGSRPSPATARDPAPAAGFGTVGRLDSATASASTALSFPGDAARREAAPLALSPRARSARSCSCPPTATSRSYEVTRVLKLPVVVCGPPAPRVPDGARGRGGDYRHVEGSDAGGGAARAPRTAASSPRACRTARRRRGSAATGRGRSACSARRRRAGAPARHDDAHEADDGRG